MRPEHPAMDSVLPSAAIDQRDNIPTNVDPHTTQFTYRSARNPVEITRKTVARITCLPWTTITSPAVFLGSRALGRTPRPGLCSRVPGGPPFTIALVFRNSGDFVDRVVDREKGAPQVQMHCRYGCYWWTIAVSTTCSILAQNSW